MTPAEQQAAEQRADLLRAIVERLELLATSELTVVDAVIDELARRRSVKPPPQVAARA